MAQPNIIQHSSLRNNLENFREVIRPAQWRYFETVLMGLIFDDSTHAKRYAKAMVVSGDTR